MKKKEFVSALKDQSADVHVSSRLRQKTLDAAYGKEQKLMKKKIPAIALAIVLSVIFCATALAVASRAGMLDYYQKLFNNTHIPENAAESIEKDVLATGDDLIDISIRELYYDGLTSRVTVDITAKDENTFLVGFDTLGVETWSSLNRLNPDFDETDTRTVAEVFKEGGYTASYSVSIGLTDPQGEKHGSSADYFYTAPGVLTFFYQTDFVDDLPKRNADFSVTLVPFLDAEGKEIDWNPDDHIRITDELTLLSSSSEEAAYVNAEPVVFSESGVTIEQMLLTVKPQELYVRLYYTISDTELNCQPAFGNEELYGQVKEWLDLEFIDPEIASEDPNAQRLAEGPTGNITSQMLSGEGETPIRMVSEFTLGLNELKDSYTVRVYDFAAKTRYDSATVTMREATEAELAAFPSEK